MPNSEYSERPPLEAVYPKHLCDNGHVIDAQSGVILINNKWNKMD